MSAYRYTDSGLDNVIIEGVNLIKDDAGDECLVIPNIGGLHREIVRGIVERKGGMSGRELRFLRTEMGMTQAELAAMLHREPLAVSRWERGESPLDGNAEALVRLHATQALKLGEALNVREVAAWCVPTAETPPIVIDGSDPSHYRLAA